MAYVQEAAALGDWPGLGAVRSAKQRRRGARRRRKRARKLSRGAAGRKILASVATRVAAGTATGRERRLAQAAGVVLRRAKRRPDVGRRMRMVRDLAARARAGPVLVTEDAGIVPPPPVRANGVRGPAPPRRRMDFVRRLAEDQARREAESGTPRVAVRPRFFEEPPPPVRQPDFGPSLPPDFDFPSRRGEAAPEAGLEPAAGGVPGWVIPAAAAAAAAVFLL